jgi:hypothetical protein
MIRTEIHAGVCGFKTVITAESDDRQHARLDISSGCADIRAMSEELKEIDAYTACFGPLCDSAVYKLASRHCSHPACPVPSGIIKTIEAACSLALPAEASIRIVKE